MKYLLLIFIVSLLNAKPFFSKTQIDCAKTEGCMLKNYMRLAECEKEEKEKCYDIEKCSPFVCTIQDVEVDDPEKPIYATKENATSCKIYEVYSEEGKEPHTDDCRYLIRSENLGTEETPNIVYPLCTKPDFYALYVDKDGTFEAYCTKLLGYGKKIEKRLLEDADLKAAKEAQEAQELAEKQAKEQAKNEALTYIGEKKGNVDKLSQSEMNVLIEKILILLGE
jgi:hypothetical protein